MALNVPVFLTRLGSSIIFAIVMLTGLLWNEYVFVILFLLVQVLCFRDYIRLMKKITPDVYWPEQLPYIVQFVCVIWTLLVFISFKSDPLLLNGKPWWPLLLCFPILLITTCTTSVTTSWRAAMQSLGGMVYIVLPVMLLVMMRLQSILLPISLILMIWTNDTMAYLVGSFIGKTPFSAISPNKTWEGIIGGALLTIIGAAIWGHFTSYYTMMDWMVLAFCASVAGNVGDLLESKFKRLADVKDSGTLMPGHGGAMDRFDSLLVATPFAFCYAYFFMPALPLTIF
ncbi:MAG: phosphatidate cytidylyltransferase [Bacteroidota bacterium]